MLRLGNTIRLSSREIERFTEITGFVPVNVKTPDDLRRYVRKCKKYYWGVSDDTKFVHYLIDREYQSALALTTVAKAWAPLGGTELAEALAGAGVKALSS